MLDLLASTNSISDETYRMNPSSDVVIYANAILGEVLENAADVSPNLTYRCKDVLSFTNAKNP
jgi:hypothetical protein